MSISVKNFLDCPSQLPLIARWIHEEFWSDKPGHSVEGMLERISHGQRTTLPIGLVAFDGESPCGTVSLIDSDVEERQDLSPWLAALYVVPEKRNKGIGRHLIAACIEASRQCGFKSLYLHTSIPSYYEALGWERFDFLDLSKTHVLKYDIRS